MIDNRIIYKIKNYGYETKLTDFINHYENHKNSQISIIKMNEETNCTSLGYMGLQLMQNCLFRSNALALGWIDSLNSENIVCSTLISRAHFELTGVVCYMWKLISNYSESLITEEECIQGINKLFLGTRNSDGIGFKAYSVMNLIDEVDKQLKKFGSFKERQFRELYGELSEFVHPNLMGMTTGSEFNAEDIDVLMMCDNIPSIKENNIEWFFLINTSFDVFWIFFNLCRLHLFTKEHVDELFRT